VSDEAARRRIERVEIDARTLAKASPLQLTEWRVLCEELGREEMHSSTGATVIVVERTEALAAVRFEGHAVERPSRVDLASSTLTALLDEYVGIVRLMMDQELPLPRLEALDMAKKVVHDRAARTLRGELPDLDVRLEGLRRLFSLVVALRVDPMDIRASRRHG
jgi:uncharacterized protein (UPF0262 family)